MRGNKMGPEERGPKTGRGLGYCNGNNKPGYESSEASQGMGRGFGGGGRGPGRGMGRVRGRGYGRQAAPINNGVPGNQNKEILDRLETIENQLNAMGDK